MSVKRLTYTGLLSDTYFHSKDIDSRDVGRLLQRAKCIPKQLLPFKGILHVIDYTKRKHVGINGPLVNLVGYHPRDIMDGGLEFVMDIFQKDDFKVYNEKIFPLIIEKLSETSRPPDDNLIFSFTYRMKNLNGNWLHLYQQCSYITDPATNVPKFCLGVITDVSSIKKDNSMLFSIDIRQEPGNPFCHHNILTNYFFPASEESKITKREREILCWLAEGQQANCIKTLSE
jgi:hypothetical protein